MTVCFKPARTNARHNQYHGHFNPSECKVIKQFANRLLMVYFRIWDEFELRIQNWKKSE